jgi:hypothetical protein
MDKPENRANKFRKAISQVDVLNVKNVASGEVYFSRAMLVDVSPTGLLLRVERENILAMNLRSTLTLSSIIGASVGFTIEVMDTYLEGSVTRTKLEGHGTFVVAVDFREDAPEYWRNCLVDLLPADAETGEIIQDESGETDLDESEESYEQDDEDLEDEEDKEDDEQDEDQDEEDLLD